MIDKIRKMIRISRSVNVWQTLRLYYAQPHDKSAALHICNKSLIHIDKGARIEMKPHAILEFNMIEDPFRKARPSKLILKKNSHLICKGHIQMFEAVKIECSDDSVLEIGNKTYINHDSEIRCRSHICIGNHCSIAYNVLIQDSDYHTIYSDNGLPKPQTLPIIIGDNVWIGANVIILKGVKIGDGAVVAAGSVVSKDIPSGVLVAGNPARVIRENVQHE